MLVEEHIVKDKITKLRESSQTMLQGLLWCRKGGDTGFYNGFSDNTIFPHRQVRESRQRSSPSTSRDTAQLSPGREQGPPEDLTTGISNAEDTGGGELPTTLPEVRNAVGGPILGVAVRIVDHVLTSGPTGAMPMKATLARLAPWRQRASSTRSGYITGWAMGC